MRLDQDHCCIRLLTPPSPHRLPYILFLTSHSSENSSRYWFCCYSVTTRTVAACEQRFGKRNWQQQGNGFLCVCVFFPLMRTRIFRSCSLDFFIQNISWRRIKYIKRKIHAFGFYRSNFNALWSPTCFGRPCGNLQGGDNKNTDIIKMCLNSLHDFKKLCSF